MIPSRAVFRIPICVLLVCAAGFSGHAADDLSARDLLISGWQEYRFLSLEVAENKFSQALEVAEQPELKLEALVGLGMTFQFREQGTDLEKADDFYAQAMALNPEPEIRNLVLSNRADLYLALDRKEEALNILETLIAESLDTVIGQDALRRWVGLRAPEYGTPESVAIADQAAAWLEAADIPATRERPFLMPVLYAQLGDYYFWAGEYEKAVAQFEGFSRVGSANNTSYGSQASNLYRLANLYENRLNDPDRAGSAYRRLVTDFSNSQMAYYSLERAIELGAMTREEADRLDISGLTSEILDELFARAEGTN